MCYVTAQRVSALYNSFSSKRPITTLSDLNGHAQFLLTQTSRYISFYSSDPLTILTQNALLSPPPPKKIYFFFSFPMYNSPYPKNPFHNTAIHVCLTGSVTPPAMHSTNQLSECLTNSLIPPAMQSMKQLSISA